MEQWFKETILKLKLCPFAQKPWDEGRIKLIDCPAQSLFESQQTFLDELDNLHSTPLTQLSTTLIGFPDWIISFDDFLDFTQSMEELLEEADLAEHFQLVCFHPNFQMSDLPAESMGHWPNSSPYPILHILRALEVAQVRKPDLGIEISRANEKMLASLSEAEKRRHYPWKFL